MNKHLVVIVGPTAVGKTAVSIRIAHHLKTEIISADSRQFFRQMSIGTAKPTKQELNSVPHYFIDSLEITEDYNAFRFESDVLKLLDELYKEKDVVIMTGGSGLYVQAVCEGIDLMPDIPAEIRNKWKNLYDQHGIVYLQEKLEEIDPDYFHEVDQSNPKRLIRALEIYDIEKKPFSSYRKNTTRERPFNIIKIGLERDRVELYKRINLRMDEMIAEGLFEEARQLYPYRSKNALNTVGYKEIFNYFDADYDREEAVRLLKRNSRRYAKRQMTWFKKDPDITWFYPDQMQAMIEFIEKRIR